MRKYPSLFLLVLATAILPATAETRVRLSAKTEAMGRATEKAWKTTWGSYDQDIYRARTISATVACTLGGGPAKVLVQWIGSPAGQPNDKLVTKVEEKPLNLTPGAEGATTFSTLFVENDTKYAALGIRDRAGFKYVGWVVRVIAADGTILAGQASSQPLLAKFPPTATAEE